MAWCAVTDTKTVENVTAAVEAGRPRGYVYMETAARGRFRCTHGMWAAAGRGIAGVCVHGNCRQGPFSPHTWYVGSRRRQRQRHCRRRLRADSVLHAVQEEGVAGDGFAGVGAGAVGNQIGNPFGAVLAAADFYQRADSGPHHVT